MATQPEQPSVWTVPSPEELGEVEAVVYSGYDECEDVVSRLEHVASMEDDAETPTLADIGALWVFVDQLRTNASQFTDIADRCEQLLSELNSARNDRLLQEPVRS